MRVLCILVCIFIVSTPVYAQDHLSGTATQQSSELPATRIETDEQAGAIRFFIDGQEAVRIDAAGLHVRDDVRFGGTIKDVGLQSGDFADIDEKPAREGE